MSRLAAPARRLSRTLLQRFGKKVTWTFDHQGGTYDPATGLVTAPTVVDEYAIANRNTSVSFSATRTAVAQSFKPDNGPLIAESIVFSLSPNGSPTGDMFARFWSHTGTYGTSSVPTGGPLASSQPVAASGLASGFN